MTLHDPFDNCAPGQNQIYTSILLALKLKRNNANLLQDSDMNNENLSITNHSLLNC